MNWEEPRMSKITKEDLIKKLEYIGLDLNEIPNFLQEVVPLNFRPTNTYDEKKFKVYRYVPINKIQILLSPTDRTIELKERYKQAFSLYSYLVPEKEEDISKHADFLTMLNEVTTEEIEQIEKEQEILNEKIPFEVKYKGNYLWQVYYSDYADTYFMIVPIKDAEYAALFYLLKRQLAERKKKKVTKLFIPVCYEDYSGEFLRKSEIVDLENYLWLFTGDWPQIYEVYDKKENLSIQIVGNTRVYEKVKSKYNTKLLDKEKAEEFYKLVKALFILQTELPKKYKFDPKINIYGGLDFYYQDKRITFSNISEFIKQEYLLLREKLKELDKENIKLEERLNKRKKIAAELDFKYLSKEKQIATYLECKKTFLGKVKYFFSYGKAKSKKRMTEKLEVIEAQKNKQQGTMQVVLEEYQLKQIYTIEDLVTLCHYLDKKEMQHKNLKLDETALENKIENMEKKLENAETYLKEIEDHKKSIFEFWKFANKDENLGLNVAQNEEMAERNRKLHRAFDYEEDIEEFGIKVDEEQRKLFTKEECDSLFVTRTDLIKVLNSFRQPKQEETQKILQQKFTQIMTQFEKENKGQTADIDIFGGILEDKTKIRVLANKKHREIEKNFYKILGIHKNMDLEQFENNINKIREAITSAVPKMKAPYQMSIYMSGPCEEDVTANDLAIFHMNPENVLEGYQEQIKEINLYKLNIEEQMPLIFYTNILFYDNLNKTLPLGMDITEEVLIDMNLFELQEVKQTDFRINQIQGENTVIDRKVYVYEYALKLK